MISVQCMVGRGGEERWKEEEEVRGGGGNQKFTHCNGGQVKDWG